ncbi:UDP-4-amino-4,6-dideoxy-N-acetyl-beta-L-altrosamine transaminase [Paenibacillus radicis (ex Xue et al. 2023)]|uniref:UDP-4-amino-4, 6-dideoxy-N-acetyl-beta-L-altrosamine transaminase n=1 Tax=Paenibacillus radicis (ex Xue et al. 2023) TaxID=2972489 RepID=A0ABT1YGT6_9BACL|nr:UDP-4-amino-4,6-dideoxy-N-acetyl-beta-L-altrosamine transaminase [Paenibacillus radicis (ex Xue et al. 2023)]MCR8632391.1 UDP-4-amino-4,6-dideoxy-N-acetyl-beta-L-altrosamine transaminase [Paenibacillus radicis (ex Xue et al. 2023)]
MEKLALHGGQPVRSQMLQYGQQWINETDVEAVVKSLTSGYITQGPAIELFEKAVADYAGVKYAVAFSSGTAALHGACFAAGIGEGDEVITTPITFVASSNCVLYQGGKPVFADIDATTYNLCPHDTERKITEHTKAIVAVDFTGQPVQMERFRDLANRHGLIIIQDAAHSLGALYDGKKIGTLADMTMFSFHPLKHVTTAEGGMIVTDNEEFYQKLVLFRSHGITKDPELLNQNDGPWYYEMQALGYHYRMTDLQASLGTSQMNRLDEFVTRRREIAALYTEAFRDIPGIVVPYQLEKANSSWHLYVLRFDKKSYPVGRKELFNAYRAENIGVHVHYIPVYNQPYYQELGYAQGQCANAESYYEEALTLPLFPKMTDQDVQDVIDATKKIVGSFRKNPVSI